MSLSVSRIQQSVPLASLSSVGWTPGEQLQYDEWLRQGSRLGMAGRNASWWVGDWLQYGTQRYGRNYAAAARVTGYDRQTLMNLVYVATRFEVSRRRENLSWSHHAELAPLDEATQEYWLDRAVEDQLSVRDLREELSHAKQGKSGRSRSARLATNRPSKRAQRAGQVVCPECGHRFAVPDGSQEADS